MISVILMINPADVTLPEGALVDRDGRYVYLSWTEDDGDRHEMTLYFLARHPSTNDPVFVGRGSKKIAKGLVRFGAKGKRLRTFWENATSQQKQWLLDNGLKGGLSAPRLPHVWAGESAALEEAA